MSVPSQHHGDRIRSYCKMSSRQLTPLLLHKQDGPGFHSHKQSALARYPHLRPANRPCFQPVVVQPVVSTTDSLPLASLSKRSSHVLGVRGSAIIPHKCCVRGGPQCNPDEQ